MFLDTVIFVIRPACVPKELLELAGHQCLQISENKEVFQRIGQPFFWKLGSKNGPV